MVFSPARNMKKLGHWNRCELDDLAGNRHGH